MKSPVFSRCLNVLRVAADVIYRNSPSGTKMAAVSQTGLLYGRGSAEAGETVTRQWLWLIV